MHFSTLIRILGASLLCGGLTAEGQVIVGEFGSLPRNDSHAFFLKNGVPMDLGTLGGGTSHAFGVNVAGEVVGWSETATGLTHAFLWSNGVMQDLGTLGGPNSYANGINAAGQVVGRADTASGSVHAFLWDSGVMQDLGTLGGSSSGATAINSAGQVVGAASLAIGDVPHAFLWSNGVMQDLDTLGTVSSLARGINDAGQVIGVAASGGGAFLWSKGVMQDLGNLANNASRNSVALGINAAGQVVGYSNSLRDNHPHAFLWENGVMRDLGTLGGNRSFATAINSAGQVVGYSEGFAGTHAFLWANSAMRDLGTLGGLSSSAYGIADSSCGRNTLTDPFPTSSAPQSIGTLNGWRMSYAISPQRGLELSDVYLGSRYMAKSMSLPYFSLKTSGFSERRCILTPNADLSKNQPCATRLVDFKTVTGASPNLKAIYEVDNISTDPNACVLLTQEYQFSPPVYPAIDQAVKGCEPAGSLVCAAFKPLVSYEFHPANSTDTLTYLNSAQRFHFSVDAPDPLSAFVAGNNSISSQDCNWIPLACNPVFPFFLSYINSQNPLLFEAGDNAVNRGQPGRWDNFHQTNRSSVTPPVPVPPGCPECVHMHWRWSTVFGTPWNSGQPIIPTGSDQSVDFAIVRYRAGEEDPNHYTDLIGSPLGEPLGGSPLVFWYSATGYQDHDTFFGHGVFFSPPSSGPANLKASISHTKSGNIITVVLTLSNDGPGVAKSISVNQVLPRVTMGTGTITYAGASLPIDIGNAIPGDSIGISLTFNVPSTVKRFLLVEGISFQNESGPIQGSSFTQAIIP